MYQSKAHKTGRGGTGITSIKPELSVIWGLLQKAARRLRSARRFLLFLLFLIILPVPLPFLSGTAAHAAPAFVSVHGPRLLLVLPFQNASGDPTLGWIGEAAPQIFNQRLAAAGFLPISRENRLYALDHLGLPADFQPSLASTIKLANTLDAAYVVVGSFTTSQQRFTASARVIDTSTLHMSPPIEEQADMKDLLSLFNSMAWRVARQIDPQFGISQASFVTADAHLPVGVFEDYVRGLIAPDPEDGIRRLEEAVRLDPGYTPALMALGMAYFDNQQYQQAATTLGRMPTDAPHARKADFYRGLAFLYTGGNAKAEDAFAFVAEQLPLPVVLNNEGVARSRQGKDASSLFRRAAAADPTDADYPFNLAIALARRNDIEGALQAIEQSLRLQPDNPDAVNFETALKAQPQAPSQTPAPSSAASPAGVGPTKNGQNAGGSLKLPQERIKRTLDEAAFQQLAAEMENAEAASVAALPPDRRAATLTEQGMIYMDKGLVLQAEHEFRTALRANSSNAEAHAGLAEVNEKTGNAAGARKEAHASLNLKPNVTAYLVLARLDLAAKQTASASRNVESALRLQPENAAALNLKRRIEAGTQAPAQQ